MKGNPIINDRIEYFTKKKKELLKVKKSERRDDLKTIDQTISRLKRWNRELEAKKNQEMIRKAGEKMAEACQNTVKAVKDVSEALGKLQSKEKPRGVNCMAYKTFNGKMI